MRTEKVAECRDGSRGTVMWKEPPVAGGGGVRTKKVECRDEKEGLHVNMPLLSANTLKTRVDY